MAKIHYLFLTFGHSGAYQSLCPLNWVPNVYCHYKRQSLRQTFVSGLYSACYYSVPFYRPTTLQHTSPLGSRTFLTEFIIGRFFLLTVDVFSAFFTFGWTVISVGFFPIFLCTSITPSLFHSRLKTYLPTIKLVCVRCLRNWSSHFWSSIDQVNGCAHLSPKNEIIRGKLGCFVLGCSICGHDIR